MTRKTVLALVAVALAVSLVTAADKANVTITEWDTPTKDPIRTILSPPPMARSGTPGNTRTSSDAST